MIRFRITLVMLIILIFSEADVYAKPQSLDPNHKKTFEVIVKKPVNSGLTSSSKASIPASKTTPNKMVQKIVKPVVNTPKSSPSSLNKNYGNNFVKKEVRQVVNVRLPVTPPKSSPKGKNISKPIVNSSQPKSGAYRTTKASIPLSAPRFSIYNASNQPKPKRKAVVVIDAGHGGKDPGASGKLGTREKDVTLKYALALKSALERSGNYRVIMTRSNDRFVDLLERVKIARRGGGDIMISIHADSNPNKNTRGFSIYTINQRRAEIEARRLLNKSDYEEVVRGVRLKGQSQDVKEAIIDFAAKGSKDDSDDLSLIIAKNLGKKAKPLGHTNREASLAVLTGLDIPSALLELGYLSNIIEERLLRDESHKQKIVSMLKIALDEYFAKNSHLLK